MQVSELGLGCIGMSFAYGAAPEKESIKTIHEAVERGVNFLDTAEMYGPYTNEELLGRALKPIRSKVQVATKFGFRVLSDQTAATRMTGLNSHPEHIRQRVDASLKRLGIETIDLLYQHRVDPAVPIEDVVGAMSQLVDVGKVRFLGLSDVSTHMLERAHAVHRISAVQGEYSLWSREPEHGMLQCCQALGVGFVPSSPLGRGLLTGTVESVEALADKDFCTDLPRFQRESIEHTLERLRNLSALARQKSCSLAQLALAWLLKKTDYIVPVPAMRRLEHLKDNLGAVDVVLTANDMFAIGRALEWSPIMAARYPLTESTLIDR